MTFGCILATVNLVGMIVAAWLVIFPAEMPMEGKIIGFSVFFHRNKHHKVISGNLYEELAQNIQNEDNERQRTNDKQKRQPVSQARSSGKYIRKDRSIA